MSIAAFASLKEWAPFKIDALGIVTMLGAEKMDLVLGQFTWNPFVEWLPLLGSYVIANNQITEPMPGFTLYNITDGILATDLAGWFTRWLVCQDLTFCSTTIHILPTAAGTRRRQRPFWRDLCSYALAGLTPVLIILGILIGDWWGVANGTATFVSVLVRQVVLSCNRRALDRAVEASEKTSIEEVKVLVSLPSGRVVTIRTTRGIVIDCLLTTLRPLSPRWYDATRAVGWAVFGAHVISLGMAGLFCQVFSVLLLLMPTVLAARQIGTEDKRLGRRLVVKRMDSQVQFRAAAYARLDLTQTEEDSMVLWHLFPHRSNTGWWAKYQKTKGVGDFSSWNIILAERNYATKVEYPV